MWGKTHNLAVVKASSLPGKASATLLPDALQRVAGSIPASRLGERKGQEAPGCSGGDDSEWKPFHLSRCEMLCLSRKFRESLVIGGNVTVTVLEIRGDRVKLGIAAPHDVTVNRSEIELRIAQEPHHAA